MIGSIYFSILDSLEQFGDNLNTRGVDYELRCLRKRRSCLVFVSLWSKSTNKKVLHLNLKIRTWSEFGDLDELLSSCKTFASSIVASSSPEY